MNDEEPPRPSGIGINIKAPKIESVDIYDNTINSSEILRDYDGLLIDFFRGNW